MKKSFALVFSLVTLLMASSSAFACACCINPGYYEISTRKPTGDDVFMFGEFKFGIAAQFYMSEAGFDSLNGLAELKQDDRAGKSTDLSVTEEFAGRSWRLTVKTGAGRQGSLTLPLPPTMVRFKVDMHDNQPGTEASLYKELRFKGRVGSGTGFFRKDVVRSTSYFLVLQGRGNGCDSSADYTDWRLELNGPKAEYAFFGKLN